MGTSATPAASAAQQAAQQQQLNLMNRQLILQTGVSVKRQLPPQTVNPAQNPVIQFNAQNFGLLKSFYIPFKATIQNNDTANTLTLTDFGISNLFSRTTFTDLNQYLRVNTDQKHLDMRASVYYGRPFLRANALTTNRMANYGDNFATITSPATIAPSTSATINGYVEIPVTMDHANLTGAILMAATTVNATVTLTVNPQPFAAANTDTTNAIYSGTTNAVITSVTVSPYQMAIDQLPVDSKGNYIIPALDVSTVYELLASQAGGQITAGVENPYLYAPFRKFLTTINNAIAHATKPPLRFPLFQRSPDTCAKNGWTRLRTATIKRTIPTMIRANGMLSPKQNVIVRRPFFLHANVQNKAKH